MVTVLVVIAALVLAVQAFIGLSFFISCLWEQERRASLFAGLQFVGMLALLVCFLMLAACGFFHRGLGLFLLILGYVLGGAGAYFFLRRTGSNPRAVQGTKGRIHGEVMRFDEREQVFARNRSLPPGSEQYKRFYEEHPGYEAFDTRRRERGGPIGHPGTIDRPHEEPDVAMTLASQNMCLFLSTPEKVAPEPHFFLKEKVKAKKVVLSPEEASERVKGYVLHLGASLVGITEINPLWIYSRRGEIFHENWEDWGREIEIRHKYAIVFAEEMDFRLVGTGPHTPTMMESMGNYAKGAYISTQVAGFIANLGYSAAANHLRHYDGLMVPWAVDAGLGELGRLGYLITKELGPRVRLSAVTTDLPLVPDKPVDIGVEDFCEICRKCSACCPSGSIPVEGQTVVNGTLRWKLNEETCFEYWGKVGTDCNVCMRVCPWSHARTFPHRIIVALITRNRLARRVFSVMDDIFYGSKPKAKAPPTWARFDGR
ncbi:MAG: reductive dehalogenase [Deltaproteobacteria bacterium]|nr:reductive dehalogenase [Deltaproteobacteria bacterium]